MLNVTTSTVGVEGVHITYYYLLLVIFSNLVNL